MVLSANEAREIIEKVTNDERNKVFEDIKNYAKRGATEVGFLKLSIDLETELKSLGYDVKYANNGVKVSWATPTTTEEVVPKIDNTTPTTPIEEPILDKPIYTDDTLTSQPIEGEVLDDGTI